MAAITLLALDIDSVTKGTLVYGPKREETNRLAYSDFDVIPEAQRRRLRIARMTTPLPALEGSAPVPLLVRRT